MPDVPVENHLVIYGHLRDALLSLERARQAAQHANPVSHRETILYEIASAEASVTRARGLSARPPP